MSARVVDVMTANVVAVRSNASFKEIAARLRERRVSAFPVLDGGDNVVGVVSATDLMPKEALEAGVEGHPGWLSRLMRRMELRKASGVTAADLMTRPAVTIGPYDLVSHAAHLMYDHRISSLPVVSDGQLIGVVSRSDVLSVFGRADDEICREITDKIMLGEFLVDPARFTVTVKDGVVTLAGAPENTALGHDIVGEVRRMEGVVTVRDQLAYPDESAAASGRRARLS